MVAHPSEAGWWLPALKADTHKGCPKGVGVRGDPDYPERRTGTPPEVRLRRSYPIKAKKTLPIREIREVREVRDDRPACSLIQLI